MLVIEEVLSRAALALNLPADVVRERNFYRPGDVTHYGEPVGDAERMGVIWGALKASSGFADRREDIDRFNARSVHHKRGLAMTPVKFGISFTATFYNQAGAVVLVYRDGTVQVNHGGTEMGQGLFTKILHIAADSLGVPASHVRVMPTRTDKVPNTSATAASSGADLNGAAVQDACRQIKARLAAVAGAVLDCEPSEVVFEDAIASARGKSIEFGVLCETAYKQRVPLLAEGFYRTPDIHFNFKTSRGRPFHYFAYGAAVSEIEVDGFTGQYRLLRTDILHDAGASIAPVVDRGQIEGGFLQGVGWLTIEELLWDDKGRVSTGGASTYKLPSWSEVPDVFNVEMLERAAQADVVMGSKAVGEPPLMLAFSVREALREAIVAYGEGRPFTFDSPATPERVFFAVRQVRHPALT
jgi:xanthine dehydrogenase large subunit